jgi:predicted MFS family arabinose efflux permease
MQKKMFSRCIFGFELGVFIGYLITILVSLYLSSTEYSPVMTPLIAVTGSELMAVILQFFLFGILGVGFGFGSLIFEMENWSILKQTIVHFIIITIVLFPIAYFGEWTDHTIVGILIYCGIAAVVYLIIYLIRNALSKKEK